MKRIFSFILTLLLSVTGLSWAAVGNGTVWEYRTTATNTNLNGGGYDSTISGAGTDYTLQDAAQISLTDITCAQNSVTINSTAGLFTSAMVGNAMQFTNAGSHTAGFYFVVAYISTSSVRLDRTPYTGAGTSSGGTAKLGGALYLPTDALLEVMVSGNVAWLKNGTYTLTGAISIGTAVGANTRHIKFTGYNSTRGDNPTLANRPTISQGGNATTFGVNWTVENIIFSGSNSSTMTSGANPGFFVNCAFNNTNTTSTNQAFGGTVASLIGCDIQSRSGRAILVGGGTHLINTYIHDSRIGIIGSTSNWFRLINSVVASCNTGIQFIAASNPSSEVTNTVFYKCTTAIDSSGGFLRNTIYTNNIFHTGTNAILDTVTNSSSLFKYNIFYNYTNNLYSGFGTLDSTNITGQDPLFTDVSNRNFTLQQGSPAINSGYPITNSGVSGTYKLNSGVDQTQTSTGGTKSWAY